ncbi:MAG TPA: hypothetical protein VJP77_06255, partial [Planctomycetota bacterium]|nr:hypothetical protein [Planctomycetota bacterium]
YGNLKKPEEFATRREYMRHIIEKVGKLSDFRSEDEERHPFTNTELEKNVNTPTTSDEETENPDLAILRNITTDESKRKTEAALVRTYLKYQTSEQFCYVCENGYHKAANCELLVNKVTSNKPEIKKVGNTNDPIPIQGLSEIECSTETINVLNTLVEKVSLNSEANEFNLMEVEDEEQDENQDSSNPMDEMQSNQTPIQSWNDGEHWNESPVDYRDRDSNEVEVDKEVEEITSRKNVKKPQLKSMLGMQNQEDYEARYGTTSTSNEGQLTNPDTGLIITQMPLDLRKFGNFHPTLSIIIPASRYQAYLQGDLLPAEEEFVNHFNNNAEYHKALKGLTILMECKCNACNGYHVREEPFYRNAEWTSSGFKQSNRVENPPCVNDDLQILVDNKIAFVFPTFVSLYLSGPESEHPANIVFWSDFIQYRTENRKSKF